MSGQQWQGVERLVLDALGSWQQGVPSRPAIDVFAPFAL